MDANGTSDTGAIYLYRVADGVGKKRKLPLSDALNASEDATSPRTIEDIFKLVLMLETLRVVALQTYQQADFLYVLNGNSANAYYYQEAQKPWWTWMAQTG